VTASPKGLPEVPADGLPGLLSELEWRGLLEAATPGLAARLATGRPIAGYNGFDPSGSSLHIGSLVPIFGLLHLQRRGGRPVVLVGGATGMVGDPSGTSAERNLLDRETLDANVAAIRSQLERFLDFTGPSAARVVNNLDWLGPISMLEFLRDVGKHFTIPYMLAKDSVQTRIGAGLSYTEFSYMLLQAADFRHLYRTMGVELQSGGADQWGNITAGLELIRRSEGHAEGDDLAHGLSYRLLLDPSGAKFGKTAAGTSVWLDPNRTSPYAFYQYWLDRQDAEVPALLRTFTLLSHDEILAIEAEQALHPEARSGQRTLAYDITARVHGDDVAKAQEAASRTFFAPAPIRDPEVFRALYGNVDSFEFDQATRTAGEIAISSGSYSSNSELRRAIEQGSYWLGGQQVKSSDEAIPPLVGGEFVELRTGKKRKRIGRLKR
jgi:tyrosyl-tRNA synthetase